MSHLQLIEHLDMSFAAAGCTECTDKEIIFFRESIHAFYPFFFQNSFIL